MDGSAPDPAPDPKPTRARTAIVATLGAGLAVAAVAVAFAVTHARPSALEAARQTRIAEETYARAERVLEQAGPGDDAENLHRWAQGRELFSTAAAQFAAAGNHQEEGRALYEAALCTDPRNAADQTWDAAIRRFREAVRVGRAAGDEIGCARATSMLGVCLMPTVNPEGDWEQARTHLTAAVEALRRWKITAELGDVLVDLARCHHPDVVGARGDWAHARGLYEEAERAFADGELPESGRALAAFELARSWRPDVDPAGDWARAIEGFTRASKLYAEASDARGEADALLELGTCILRSGSPAADAGGALGAIRALQRAAGLYRTLGFTDGEVSALTTLSDGLRPDRSPVGDWARAHDAFARLVEALAQRDPEASGEALYAQALCSCHGLWSRAGEVERRLVRRAEALMRSAGRDARADEMAASLR